MDLGEFREYCLAKPRVTEGTPFGETVLVFKVSGKMLIWRSSYVIVTTKSRPAIT